MTQNFVLLFKHILIDRLDNDTETFLQFLLDFRLGKLFLFKLFHG